MPLKKKKPNERTYKKQTGRILRKNRTASRLTQAQVASHLGVTRETYGFYERGEWPLPAYYRQPLFDLTGSDPLPQLLQQTPSQQAPKSKLETGTAPLRTFCKSGGICALHKLTSIGSCRQSGVSTLTRVSPHYLLQQQSLQTPTFIGLFKCFVRLDRRFIGIGCSSFALVSACY